MIELLGLSLIELENILQGHNIPKYRAKQIFDYIYKRGIFDIEDMIQLPKDLRIWLCEHMTISVPNIVSKSMTKNGDTIKLLLALSDQSYVETVLMKHNYGNSICLSSQVGCAMGCTFCASTQEGLFRNLKAFELVAQALLLKHIVKENIHSVVIMGAGEPMQNYDEVIKALRCLHEESTFHIGYRRMTISTCGIPQGMLRLAEESIPITLALSLHAPNQMIRNRLMPISQNFPLDEVLSAMEYYMHRTKRKLTFEYILIKGINASSQHAKELATLLHRFKPAHINLIPVNGNEHINYYKPSSSEIAAFRSILEKAGFDVVVRKEMGDQIKAACGQLKVKYIREKAMRE